MIPILNFGLVGTLIMWQIVVFIVPFRFHAGDYSTNQNIPADEIREIVKVPWTTLMFIDYEEKYFEETDMEMLAPVFTAELKKLDGKRVEVEGFVIPLDEKGTAIALSANPYASCFFCGQASPASVMSIYFKDQKRKYEIDEYLHFEGELKLNYDDPLEFYYILKEAKEVEEY